MLSGIWVVSLSLAGLAISGGSEIPVLLIIALIPGLVWLMGGSGHWGRHRSLALAWPLWRALRRGELVLFFQPKAEAVGGRVRSVEALVRWRHPRRGLLLPAEFLPAIQDGVLERPFNRFVIGEAIRCASDWQAKGRPLRVSVNVSPGYVVSTDFVPHLREVVERSGVDPSQLVIEVPEVGLDSRHVEAFNAAVHNIKELGVGVSIDDFGMGESSLARLVELPIDVLKIDRKFVAGLSCDLKADRVVHTAIDLGHSLGLNIVAEGVETDEQWVQLTAWGCDLIQGFKLQRPVPPEELWQWLDDTGRDLAELGERVNAVSNHRRRFERGAPEEGKDAARRSGAAEN